MVEGTALRVTDAQALRTLAAAWFAEHGDDWRFDVRGQEQHRIPGHGG